MIKKLPIIIHGMPYSKILEKKCYTIIDHNTKIKNFIQSLKTTAFTHKLISLSAIQTGQEHRIFVYNKKYCKDGLWKINKEVSIQDYISIINPRITHFHKLNEYGYEECASYPGFKCRILRSENIVVNYLDEEFNEKKKSLKDFEARVFLHEFDHLLGKSIISFEVCKGDMQYIPDLNETEDFNNEEKDYLEEIIKKMEKIKQKSDTDSVKKTQKIVKNKNSI